jgi:MoxR-like ATPase
MSSVLKLSKTLDAALEAANRIILGKSHPIRLAFACLLARGHLLIEDVPGVGKTTLAQTLARLLGLDFARIQFTSDMLPADILGVSIFDHKQASFQFHPGPIFTSLLLADEVNRATPKTQSALLEAMEERQVTVEGRSRPLPDPFFVIATQNPTQQIGTYPLPESQLDRFLMRIALGYPDRDTERSLLAGADRRRLVAELPPLLPSAVLHPLQSAVHDILVSPALLDYIQALLSSTRHSPHWVSGLSPRAGLGLLAASRAWALLAGRDHVLPEDVQAVLPAIATHRLRAVAEQSDRMSSADISALLIQAVPIP